MINQNTLSNTNLSSFFQNKILDNDNNSVTDINDGLSRLFGTYLEIEPELTEEQRYLANELEEGYPDLIALHSILKSEEYWWWILLLNKLEDPFMGICANWVYSINSKEQINTIIAQSNTKNKQDNKSRVGTVVELN